MQSGKTHFEQIPVETVKQIAQLLPREAERMDIDKAKPDEKESGEGQRRRLAQQIQNEHDPRRMMALVEELLISLESQHSGKSVGTAQNSSGTGDVAHIHKTVSALS